MGNGSLARYSRLFRGLSSHVSSFAYRTLLRHGVGDVDALYSALLFQVPSITLVYRHNANCPRSKLLNIPCQAPSTATGAGPGQAGIVLGARPRRPR
jgi:hypothetical protein